MKLYSALARGLKDHGIDDVFGLLGDANMFMVHSYVAEQNGKYYDAAHEVGATLMSLGYACRSGRLGVATVTHGPGLTNTVTALVEGVRNRIPMLLLAGDAHDARRHSNSAQWIAQREVVLSTGAGFEPIGSPQSALGDLSLAIRRAHIERRPVVLNIPATFLPEEVEYRHVPANPVWQQLQRPDVDAIDQAAGMLASARSPLVLLGRGVREKARAVVLQLAERIGAPVATTLAGKGHATGQAFGLGVFGTLATPIATDVILSADCIIAFGASLNPFTTDGGTLTRDKALIQCDIDPFKIGLHTPVTAGVVGDAGVIAEALIEAFDEAEIEPRAFRSPELAQKLAERSSHRDAGQLSAGAPIDITTASLRLNAVLPENRTVVLDGGRWAEEPFKLIDVPSAQAWSYTIGFGSIGLGMGAALGAGIAARDDTLVLFAGDGGFMNGGLAEFNTAVRHNIDLITVIANDGAYGAEHVVMRRAGIDPALSMFTWPDFAPVADALGGQGITVREVGDLELVEKAIRERERPLLIDIKLDPDDMPELTLPGGHR